MPSGVGTEQGTEATEAEEGTELEIKVARSE